MAQYEDKWFADVLKITYTSISLFSKTLCLFKYSGLALNISHDALLNIKSIIIPNRLTLTGIFL